MLPSALRRIFPERRDHPLHYEGTIIRPPSEADSILLQVTVACSHNKCAFCGAYAGEHFRIKKEEVIFEDIEFAAAHMPFLRRVFLCDGDALIIRQATLVKYLERIRERLPQVTRVGTYANVKSMKTKSVEDLKVLRSLGLGIVYMGLESGDDEVLKRVNKEGNLARILEGAQKVKEAGIKLSVTAIVGLAGMDNWERHARLTGEAFTTMAPDYAAALCLMPAPGTKVWDRIRSGEMVLPDGLQMVRELRVLLEHTEMKRGMFLANHASNYVPLRLRLPQDKERGLAQLDAALGGRTGIRPEGMRRF